MTSKTIQETIPNQLLLRREYERKLQEARAEYDEQTSDFNMQLKSDIAAYNEVVTNTLRKFVSDSDLWYKLTNELLISSKSEFKDFDAYTGEYLFETSSGKIQRIHPLLLKNNPITVAMYTRRKIRAFQATRREENFNTAKKNLESAKRALTLKQKELNEAQRITDAIAKTIAKREAKRAARLKTT